MLLRTHGKLCLSDMFIFSFPIKLSRDTFQVQVSLPLPSPCVFSSSPSSNPADPRGECVERERLPPLLAPACSTVPPWPLQACPYPFVEPCIVTPAEGSIGSGPCQQGNLDILHSSLMTRRLTSSGSLHTARWHVCLSERLVSMRPLD